MSAEAEAEVGRVHGENNYGELQKQAAMQKQRPKQGQRKPAKNKE